MKHLGKYSDRRKEAAYLRSLKGEANTSLSLAERAFLQKAVFRIFGAKTASIISMMSDLTGISPSIF